MKILVIGITGMLGHAVFTQLSRRAGFRVFGTARSDAARHLFPDTAPGHLLTGIDVEDAPALACVFAEVKPDCVINCVGLVKQLAVAKDPLLTLPINSLLPHRLAKLGAQHDARLIHISTDCVFSGAKGQYVESDFPDADDLYGRSKLLGEVDYPHAITLRTSIIGPEFGSGHSLLEWFLAQQGSTKGFSRAIFSGLPTIELARVIAEYVIPHPTLHGLYHVASAPINKYDLLKLFAQHYGKTIEIVNDEALVIDRSLDASRFAAATGYIAPDWSTLVARMAAEHKESSYV